MNITADPGLLYNISQLFTVLVVYSLKNELQQIYIKYNKKITHSNLVQKPLYFEPKYKR